MELAVGAVAVGGSWRWELAVGAGSGSWQWELAEITERSDFTKDNFKNVVTKGWWFIWKELQIVIYAE